MKAQHPLKTKYLFLSLGIGTVLVLLFSSLIDTEAVSAIAQVFLSPGSLLARLGGYGGHDLQGMLLYVLGNIVFYAVVSLLVIWLAITHQAPRQH